MIQVGVRISLVVRDRDGRVVSQCDKDHDLATDQFLAWLAGYLTYGASAAVLNKNLTDEGGVARTFNFYGGNVLNNTAGTDYGPILCLGDGNGSAVTPTRADTNLVNQLHEGSASAPSVGSSTVALAAVFVNSTGSTQVIREAGLKVRARDTGGTGRDVLLFHDATAATSVADGLSVTVTYTFTFP